VDFDIPSQEPEPEPTPVPNPEEEALIAQAVAEADQEREEKRAEQKAKAAPKWNELFAKKLPPLCTIHQKPCKDFSKSIQSFRRYIPQTDFKSSRYLVQTRANVSGCVHCKFDIQWPERFDP
jgi:hypothetical protein